MTRKGKGKKKEGRKRGHDSRGSGLREDDDDADDEEVDIRWLRDIYGGNSVGYRIALRCLH